MRTLLCATALISIALVGAGCKKGPDIVGKWTGSVGAGTVEAEFKSDNTFSMGVKAGTFNITQKGDYKLEAEKLTLTTKDVDAPGLPASLVDKAKADPKFKEPKVIDIKFAETGEEFTLSNFPGAVGSTGQSITFKRVKA